MFRKVLAALGVALGLASGSGPASAFWERSQVSRCADATTPMERERYRCRELLAYADPGWPLRGAAGVAIEETVIMAQPRSWRRGISK